MMQLQDNPGLRTFSVEAMHTTFTLRLDCADEKRAQEAASACFNQLDAIEAHISRFRIDSDITRINLLEKGKSLLVSETTHACLLQAFEAQAMTAGLFDVTLGALTWPDGHGDDGARASDAGQLEVDPTRPLVGCVEPGRQIDLGGIGKGFALDQLSRTLTSYQIDSALLCAGASSILALGPHGWPITLSGDEENVPFELKARALSASGIGIQGAHVVHPDSPSEEPIYSFKRVWLAASNAALADAGATACLLMSDDEIEAFADTYQNEMTIYAEDIDSTEVRRV
jgi:FAD:protein FMN transferase